MFKYNNTKSQILMYSTIILFLIILSLSLIFTLQTRHNVLEEKESIISLEVQRERVYIERQFSKIYEDGESFSIAFDNLRTQINQEDFRDYMIETSGDLIRFNDYIIGVDLIFEQDVIENDADFIDDNRFQYDGQFITRVTINNDATYANYIENYDDQELYTRATSLLANFVTDPYYLMVNGTSTLVTTVCFPIVENGDFLGLVGIDFTIDTILTNAIDFASSYPRRDIIVSSNYLIMLNSADNTTKGESISTIHPGYLDGIAEVEQYGERIGISEFGNMEVLYKIQLGSSGDNWYIFSDVDRSLLFADVNRATFQVAYIGLILLIVSMTVAYFIFSKTTEPIHLLTKAVEKFDVNRNNFEVFDIETRKLKDIEMLKDRYVNGYRLIKRNLDISEDQANIIKNQIDLRKALETTNNINDLSEALLEKLIALTNSNAGTIYINNDNGEFILYNSIGVRLPLKQQYQENEGLIGKAVLDKKIKVIENIDEIDPKIDLGLKEVSPPNIIIFPIVHGEIIRAIIQLVSLTKYDDYQIKVLKSLNDLINFELIRQISFTKTEELLEQTEKLARELEINKDELELKNEELLSQQEELRVTNEELETQQEELRVANNELQSSLSKIEKINKDLENTQTELKQRTMEAEQANEAKSKFLANISHELRTPLNSILILSNLISENENASEKMKQYANTINSSGKDLLELINGILDLSKIESGQDELHVTKIDFDDLISSIKARFFPIAENKKLDFNISSPKKKINLLSDQKKINLILDNLLSNAFKFTKNGSVSLTIKEQDNYVSFTVADTGIGIDNKNLTRIFEEFKQIDDQSNRSFNGSGLGLAICKKYTTILQGELNVESTLNQGSKFTLILKKEAFDQENDVIVINQPVLPSKTETIQPQNVGISDDSNQLLTNEKSILIIDDNKDFLKSMKQLFNQKGMKVLLADSGERGLFMADFYLPSIILIDIELPNRNGLFIYEKLNKNPRTNEIIKYLISGKEIPKETPQQVELKPLSSIFLDKIYDTYNHIKEKRPKVLLVEDNINHRNAVKEYIDANRHRVNIEMHYVSNKKEVLEKLNKNLYSLLVIDLALEDSDNFDLIKAIRAQERYSHIPIVVYTGKVFDAEDELELNKMVQDIIIKGVKSPERLLDDIELFIMDKTNSVLNSDKEILQSKKVLIVDDDIRNIFALTGLLENYSIEVEYVTSGSDAINLLKERPKEINLILMDIMMPEMDGYETITFIRNKLHYKKIPIIALTAKTMEGEREKCINAGADEYLTKPIDKDKLLSVLRVWLQ